MKIIENIDHCYGCAACFNACPNEAIRMVPNKEGFLMPEIDMDKCILCKKCMKVCPANHAVYPNSIHPDIFAFSAEADVLFQSSSGGIFTFLAEYILKNGGYVVGAAYDSSFRVKHRIIHNNSELDMLRRSKYLQSEINDTYRRTKELLDQGEQVLYSGCPCQIAGLLRFLGKEYKNLYTVDVLCHGIPSPEMFQKHIERSYGGIDLIQDIEFRSREGWGTLFRVEKKSGKSKTLPSYHSVYIQSFLNDINLRSSCFTCQYSKMPRQGDLTIGDLWTAASLNLSFDYRKGVSIILENNSKGKKLLDSSLSNAEHKYNLQQIYGKDFDGSCRLEQLNSNLFYPSTRYSNVERRTQFFDACDHMEFEQAVHQVLHKMDVGLILYMSNNYGSIATNYSLYRAINDMGKKVAVLNNLVSIRSEAEKFARNNMNLSSNFIEKDDWKTVNECFDTFVVGSDMTWNSLEYKQVLYMMLGFAEDKKRKIAYAPSFGNRLTRDNIDETTRLICSYYMKRLDAVSVREDYGVDVCREVFDVHAEHVLDPVFLCERNIWEEVAAQSKWKPEREYLFAYILNPSPLKREIIAETAKKLNIKPIVVLDLEANFERNKQMINMDENVEKPDFTKWIAYFQNASYIITDSFHGACFSVIFEKKFAAIKNRTKQRFDSFAEMTGCFEVFYDNEVQAARIEDIFSPIDYAVVRQRLEVQRKASVQWLTLALEGELRTKEDTSCELLPQFFESLMRKTDKIHSMERAYSYEEKRKEEFEKLLNEEGTWLNAVLKKSNMMPETSNLQEINNLQDYFEEIRSEGNYVVLFSVSDEGSNCWKKFLEVSRLPLCTDLSWRNSYVAIMNGSTIVFEKKSNEEIDIREEIIVGNFAQETDCKDGKIMVSITTPQYCKLRIKSKGFTSMNGECRSEILVDNVDYSMNRTGLNIVVINKETGMVIDSFNVNTYGDINMTIHRR